MNNKRRYGIFLLLLAVAGWFIGVRPQMDQFKERSLSYKVVREEHQSYVQRLSDIEKIKSSGAAMEKSLEAFYLAFPSSSQIPEVLVMIESLAARSGIVLNSSVIGSADGNQVPVSLAFSGNLKTMKKFLTAIYNNVRTASVKSQTVTSDASGNLNVSLQLGLLYYGGGK
ncbi:hypothetical protein A3A71_01895 [Candidatus Berkelbacteria bacterium RIFCSPLOWO2_01_FULL_50_28]|uniref:Pilus assembly protein PilO n=1 Tax=Candidatus Berkelbacteria bacterium RIFCSPLOWO2_01_FULL_50_28 TaxID=1797471 RepID=A0A1F5EBI7_9BACT|nr:MAG: hypothetical protein A3F39_00140 [Candidatus Berkelbacteria bacterium RIFCSPHIGHO2_12_FULL_50_11]OGD64779.1 MAG: hypothetical protein A3A71_01895 [Candidatus Berkelbacteria bacterium RIFCSPLOWO2_01_FULL_50_28]